MWLLRCPRLTPQARRGGLKDTDAIDLLSTVFKAVLDTTGVEPQVRQGASGGEG